MSMLLDVLDSKADLLKQLDAISSSKDWRRTQKASLEKEI